MTDDDYDALSQKQLASIKRDMRVSLEDAAVRATYKVMAELAQPEQEPVAVVDVHEFYDNCANFSLLQKLPKGKHTLYTSPPAQRTEQEYERGFIDGMQEQMKRSVDRAVNDMVQRTWVGLTDDEIDELHGSPMNLEHSGELKWVRMIEAKLKEKNT
jgi:hypothetical protein